MNLKLLAAAVMGLILTGVVVAMARISLLEEGEVAQAALPAMVQVYVAKQEIGFGQSVTEDVVRLQAWPRDALPHMAITDPAVLFPKGEGARQARGHFVEDELILASKLSAHGDQVTTLPVADPALRAVAIRAVGAAATGGLIAPADQVDLIFGEGDGRDRKVTTLFMALRVLAVGDDGLLTLEVTAEDAQRLALAEQSGALLATLHMPGAEPTADLDPLDLRALLGEPAAKPVAAPKKKPAVVIRRGVETSSD